MTSYQTDHQIFHSEDLCLMMRKREKSQLVGQLVERVENTLYRFGTKGANYTKKYSRTGIYGVLQTNISSTRQR